MKTIRHENRLWVLAEDHQRAVEFARIAAAIVEREECAKVLDANAEACVTGGMVLDVLLSNAEAIRARGQK